MTKGPDWAETLEDLDRRRQHAMSMGGPERLDKHHGKGKLDAAHASSGSSTRAPSANSARSSAARSRPMRSSLAPA